MRDKRSLEKFVLKCVNLCFPCAQETQRQTGGGPADDDDGRHVAEGWSGSAG